MAIRRTPLERIKDDLKAELDKLDMKRARIQEQVDEVAKEMHTIESAIDILNGGNNAHE